MRNPEAMKSSTTQPPKELVTFIQHQLPGLESGEYKLTVSQEVKMSNGDICEPMKNAYTFAVYGDRFRLSNPAIIASVFPPDNGSGEFTTVLPHVVFTSESFPWTRSPAALTSSNAASDTDDNVLTTPADKNEDVPTWLAVLLFDEDDVTAFKELSLTPKEVTKGDLFRISVNSTSSLGANYSCFSKANVFSPQEANESKDDQIRVLDLPLKLFWQVAPSFDDLSQLAHIRQVSLANKPEGQVDLRHLVHIQQLNQLNSSKEEAPDPAQPVGTFSIVFGNRLPQTGKKASAFLVSLEGLQSFLPDNEGNAPTESLFKSDNLIRLAVLYNWTFYSTGESATFVQTLLALNGRDADSKTDAPNTNLRLTYQGTNPLVKNALNMGYVPLNESLRTAEKTVSWYRGPCVPYPIPSPNITLPVASPDQATIFDPTTGMFDLSYASAWTLGRMLALQATSFSTELYKWKRGLSQQVLNALEDEVLEERFNSVLTAGQKPDLLNSGTKYSVSHALLRTTIHSIHSRE